MKSSLIATAMLALLLVGCSKSKVETAISTVPGALSASTREAATQQGKEIVEEAFQTLASNLQSAIQQGGISSALPYCSMAALPLTRKVAEQKGVQVRRFTHKPRNSLARAEGMEKAILQEFQQALQQTPVPSPIVTNTNPGTVSFFAPIVIRQPLCLKCHGEPGKDIVEEHVALIEQLYPQDEATGFRAGDLRGAWRVDFPLDTLQSPQ